MVNAEEIAREVLRAWFSAPKCFVNMKQDSSCKNAVKAVEKLLAEQKKE